LKLRALMIGKAKYDSRIIGCLLTAIFFSVPPDATGQSEPQAPVFTLHSNTNLVVEDVVASDAHGNPIHNLTASDFMVLENGHPQTVKAFGEHSAAMPAHQAPLPRLQPGTFTNDSLAPTDGALNILLLYKLNTPADPQSTVVNAVLKYLKGRGQDRVSPSSRSPHNLSCFRDSPMTPLCSVHWWKGGGGFQAALWSGPTVFPRLIRAPITSTATPSTDTMGDSPDIAMMLSNLQDMKSEQQSFQLMLRAPLHA
jgi:hypothetical protein